MRGSRSSIPGKAVARSIAGDTAAEEVTLPASIAAPNDDAELRMDGSEREPAAQYAVRCPRCRKRAVAHMMRMGIKGTYREAMVRLGAARITCPRCGFNRTAAPGEEEAYELWYATEFDGRRLWARDRAHLDFLIAWLSSAGQLPDHADAGRVHLEALPKWLRARKNRAAIVGRLRRLQEQDDE